jgi:hypothetical protein
MHVVAGVSERVLAPEGRPKSDVESILGNVAALEPSLGGYLNSKLCLKTLALSLLTAEGGLFARE